MFDVAHEIMQWTPIPPDSEKEFSKVYEVLMNIINLNHGMLVQMRHLHATGKPCASVLNEKVKKYITNLTTNHTIDFPNKRLVQTIPGPCL